MKEKKIQCQNNNNNNCSLKGKKLHSYKQLKNLGRMTTTTPSYKMFGKKKIGGKNYKTYELVKFRTSSIQEKFLVVNSISKGGRAYSSPHSSSSIGYASMSLMPLKF